MSSSRASSRASSQPPATPQVTASLAVDDTQVGVFIQRIDQRLLELEEERRELQQQLGDLKAERVIIEARAREPDAAPAVAARLAAALASAPQQN